MFQFQKECKELFTSKRGEKSRGFLQEPKVILTRPLECFFKEDFMALHLSNPFSASRQGNWNNKTFLSDFITWFFVEIPREDFHSSCFQMHWYQLCLVYLFLLDAQFCSLWLRVSHYLHPREKDKGQHWKSGGAVSERSDERSQTNLGSCLSKVKEERGREANHREADKNLSLTFCLLREELYSWGWEHWDS